MKKIFTLAFALVLGLGLYAQNLVDLSVVDSYSTGIFDEGAIEIVVYDEQNQLVFATNGDAKTIDVFDISTATNITKIDSIDLSSYGDAPNSVAYYNGVIAVAVEADDFNANGKAVFFDAATRNYLSDVEVGVLPDMITFTNDGAKVLTANEGEPDDDYTEDPEGSISIIDMSAGAANLSQSDVSTLDFNSFNSNNDPLIRNFGPKLPFFNDFQNTNDSLDNFIFVMTSGDESWYYDDFQGDYFAEANAFNSNGPTVGWLITRPEDLSNLDSAWFSFYSAKNFSGGDLDILVSTDYDSATHPDPATATWDTITSQFALSTGGYQDTFSGRFDLGNYLDTMVSFAFYYRGAPGPGNSTLWQIDDVFIERPATLAQNLEPEYIAVTPDNSLAFVICQENNALIVVDLNNDQLFGIVGLGYKDWSMGNNQLDASNRSSSVDIRNWPVFGMYQPDAIKAFEVNGTVYLATANEGDARDYDAFSEEARVEDLVLDATAFPNAANLQDEDSLGRLKITTTLGDSDGDGEYEELYSYGARSFSIWNANTAVLVFDSEDQFEQNIFAEFPNEFNSNNDDNSSFKSRSDDKGPEPEAIEIAEINGFTLAFIGMERMGGIMTYDISDPNNPVFVSYFLNRDFSVNADDPAAGDLGPEDIRFIPASQSPNGLPMLAVANEVSGTLSLYGIGGTIGLTETERAATLQVFPNPTRDVVNFNRMVENAVLYNASGQQMMEINGESADLSALKPGIYTLQTEEGSLQIFKR